MTYRQWYVLIILCLLGISFLYLRVMVLPVQQEVRFMERYQYEEHISVIRSAILQQGHEEPSITVVHDAKILRALNAGFYTDVQNGDWVVRYSDRVLLYRPSTKQILQNEKSSHQ